MKAGLDIETLSRSIRSEQSYVRVKVATVHSLQALADTQSNISEYVHHMLSVPRSELGSLDTALREHLNDQHHHQSRFVFPCIIFSISTILSVNTNMATHIC